jgi:hypothetical protein
MLSLRARFQEHMTGEASFRVDHFIFIFAVLLGASSIIILKSGYFPSSDVFGIVFPVMVMITYGCAVTLIPRVRLRLDQAGDNLYYLGFTYTLCSLAITLYRFHATQGAADYIVSNFGIALATTIVGVVSRVWLHQMREDPLELEREARAEITDAVGRLRTEIDQAVREFNHFNRTLQQSAREAIEAQGQAALESLDKSTKQYAEVTVRALGYLEGCFTDFQKQAAELNTNSARIANALTTFSARIDEIEAPRDLLSAKIAPIFERIAEAAEETVGRATSERQRNQGVARLTARLEAVTANIDGIFEKVADREGRVTTAIERAVTVTERTAALAQQVRQWTEKFSEIEAQQAQVMTILTRASEGLQERDQQRDGALRTAVTGATSAISEFETGIQSMPKTHTEMFETELQQAQKSFRALSSSLTEGASLLASELGRRS